RPESSTDVIVFGRKLEARPITNLESGFPFASRRFFFGTCLPASDSTVDSLNDNNLSRLNLRLGELNPDEKQGVLTGTPVFSYQACRIVVNVDDLAAHGDHAWLPAGRKPLSTFRMQRQGSWCDEVLRTSRRSRQKNSQSCKSSRRRAR